jgi:chromosome partition protein MukB
MNRIHAEALALVNWKGVFYERYELDRHVTVLEGDNGAGKTTVMIAAYVVLLPDMTRLRFTNLGETGATGGDKGIWGRLGELGRPSYAALDFRLPRNERVLAGVHLERKGEPTVEPTPFLVTGLADDVRLQDILLLAQGPLEQVPEIGELRDNVARLGGRLQVFDSARDYFSALFDHGITPMRMSTDEERNKLNEMLKTSMTGGMSRGLLSELRSFLLKEEGGLAGTLQRMRANLEACRRTRTEVAEAQRLEREIGAVYEAGEEMFAAAIAATRQRAEEMSRRVQEAEDRRRNADEAATAAAAALAEVHAEVTATGVRKEDADKRMREAGVWAQQVSDALRWAREVDVRAETLAEATHQYNMAKKARDRSKEVLDTATREVAQASEGRERAAAGLGDLQKGLEELHRRADAHRRAMTQLTEARTKLERPTLELDLAQEVMDDVRAHLVEVDNERRSLSRRLDDAHVHRAEHAEAMAALVSIRADTIDAEQAHEAARETILQVRNWRDEAKRRATLAKDLRIAEAEAKRQARARDRALNAGLVWEPGHGRAAVGNALEALEGSVLQLGEQIQQADESAKDSTRLLEAAHTDICALEARAVVFRALVGRAMRISAAVGSPVDDRDSLQKARAILQERHGTLTASIEQFVEQREALTQEARELVFSGGSFPAELLKVRDELTAELLASHFEDVGLDKAPELEARLGPLAQALVVADVDAATRQLRDRSVALPTIWLIAEDATLSLDTDPDAGQTGQRDVVVNEHEARRITRIPDRPTLGRAARARRAEELKSQAEALHPTIEQAQTSRRAIDTAFLDADALLESLGIWLGGDPAAQLEMVRRRASEAEVTACAAREEAARKRLDAGLLRPRRQVLLELLPDAALLDAPVQEVLVSDLQDALAMAEQAAATIARIGDAPAVVERRLDALRHIPWADTELSDGRTRLNVLNNRRDALAEGIRALEYVADNREALRWTDAAAQLCSSQTLVPALEEQLEIAKAALDRANDRERSARDTLDSVVTIFHKTEGHHATVHERHQEARQQLAETGVDTPTQNALDDAQAQVRQAREALTIIDTRLGKLRETVGRSEAAVEQTVETLTVMRATEENTRKDARPAIDGWEKLRPQAEDAGLLDAALSDRFQQLFGGRGSVNIWPRAQVCRGLLVERLRTAHGGSEVLAEVQRWLDATDQTTGEGYLRAWHLVRDWLRRRLPAQIAEVDEPLVALGRFRDHLAGLVERLERQERDLRGASEDVANGINVQIRKAQGRVRRLTQHLTGVRFGSIQGIRVRMQRIDRMEQILRALSSGAAQELLFQANLPIEEALEEIFKRFGGGRTGGQKLLDYREYIQLQVEILRHDASEWEAANPTRLSTGEAIGVGAALMMVVLTEWERDANLLQGRRAVGSMRFLFLDEANRLDKANLGTLFDLCRHLDLQLLVAAPEVARAEGCTVFRLVRTQSEGGLDKVLVSGRRMVTSSAGDA